jgi:hypothetical protein
MAGPAKEAAAAGRPQEAEVAFLMSCRSGRPATGGDSVESANAKDQLGSLYARLALESGPGVRTSTKRAELGSRAQRLYADSLHTYQARYGLAHEKTRFAAEGLAALEQLSVPAAAPSRPAPSSAIAALAQPRPGQVMTAPRRARGSKNWSAPTLSFPGSTANWAACTHGPRTPLPMGRLFGVKQPSVAHVQSDMPRPGVPAALVCDPARSADRSHARTQASASSAPTGSLVTMLTCLQGVYLDRNPDGKGAGRE